MRRRLAAAAMAAGLFAVAGCGDDNGTASTEEVCADLESTMTPLLADLNTLLSEAGAAAAQGEEEALAEVALELDGLIDELTSTVRDGAEDAEDEEFSQALTAYADAVEALADDVVSGGGMPDMTALQTAEEGVAEHCEA